MPSSALVLDANILIRAVLGHEAAGGVETVFVAGGLGPEHAFGRVRATGFRAVDPGGVGAVRFWSMSQHSGYSVEGAYIVTDGCNTGHRSI